MNMKILRRELPIGKPTAVDIFCFLREICAAVVIQNATPLGGVDKDGRPIVVEIDESKFGKIKYNRVSSSYWIDFPSTSYNSIQS